MGRRAEVDSRPWRVEVELRDPLAKVELMTGMLQVDPCSQAELLEELRG